jgi:hypothetical protein
LGTKQTIRTNRKESGLDRGAAAPDQRIGNRNYLAQQIKKD